MKGNEVIAHAAIRYGCDGYFGYPITPQSEVMETLMEEKPWETTGMVVLQAESEVASANMVYGAASTGKRVMTSSSSPGISLMSETLSYMAGAELPCLIVNCQRGGPGLGTIQPSQGDYFQACKGGAHGDFHLIVLAPNSVQEMHDHVALGFDLAFKYRNPALILADGAIGQMMEKVVLAPQRPRKTNEEIAEECKEWAACGKGNRKERNIITSLELQSEVMEKINQRLNVIYDLLFKYKAESVEELVTLREEIREKLKKVEGGSEEIERQEKKLQETEKRMLQLAGKIHEMRVSMEGKLCATMKKLLVGLGIKHAEFQVGITAVDEFTRTGRDEVKFLFSANKNQQPGEIARVASGGEISRVMLALKYVLSGAKQLPVIILDEIDTGLSGEVAHRMSLIMREMAGRMQVISISHLPQIAAAGNCHFKVYKEDRGETTISGIRKLTPEERVQEIAGMISGQEITPAAIETAKILLSAKAGN